jgi:hypothetical protein
MAMPEDLRFDIEPQVTADHAMAGHDRRPE